METIIPGIIYTMLLLVNFIINLERERRASKTGKRERRVSTINRFNNN